MVATAAADGSLSVWEAAPGQHWKRTASLQSGRGSVTALEFAPKDHGSLLAAASSDGYARCEAAHFSRSAWAARHLVHVPEANVPLLTGLLVHCSSERP